MKIVFAFLFLITLVGCQETDEKYVFTLPPDTPVAKPLNSKFGNWKAWRPTAVGPSSSGGLFLEPGKGYLTLSFQSPSPIFSIAPTFEERTMLGAELLHHCLSQRGKDQLKWIADWALGVKLLKSIHFVRVVVRYETKPQGDPDREVYGYEARYTFENGKCGQLVPLSDKAYKESGYTQFFH